MSVNPLPPLSRDEYARLEADIVAHGVRQPIEVCAATGEMLDGHHRTAIATKHGIPFQTVAVEGLASEAEREAYAIRVNINRRNLSLEQRRVVSGRQKTLAVSLHADGWTQERIASLVGVMQQRVSEWIGGQSTEPGSLSPLPKQSHKLTKPAKEWIGDQLDTGVPIAQIAADVGVDERTVKRLNAARKKQADLDLKREQAAEQASHSDIVRIGDFRDVLADVPDESVDLIFTDPPYDREAIALYGPLAEFAARVLKPGGSLLAYCGHYALPEIAEQMGEHLAWHWLLGCYHRDGLHKSLPGVSVYVTWKPILWYVKPPFRRLDQFVVDMVDRPMPDKEAHDWSQSLVDATYYIEKLTAPNALVVDPFVGGGTTIVSAQRLGRQVLGAELDPEAASRAITRIAA